MSVKKQTIPIPIPNAGSNIKAGTRTKKDDAPVKLSFSPNFVARGNGPAVLPIRANDLKTKHGYINANAIGANSDAIGLQTKVQDNVFAAPDSSMIIKGLSSNQTGKCVIGCFSGFQAIRGVAGSSGSSHSVGSHTSSATSGGGGFVASGPFSYSSSSSIPTTAAITATGTSSRFGFAIFDTRSGKMVWLNKNISLKVVFARMLFQTNFFVLVCEVPYSGQQNVYIYDDCSSRHIAKFTYNGKNIVAIEFRKDRLIIVTENTVYVEKLSLDDSSSGGSEATDATTTTTTTTSDVSRASSSGIGQSLSVPPQLQPTNNTGGAASTPASAFETFREERIDTLTNPSGIAAVSHDPSNFVLACLGKLQGHVNVSWFPRHSKPSNDNYASSSANTTTTSSRTSNHSQANAHGVPGAESIVFEAHSHNIRLLCLNYEGTLLATVSDQGTVVRVFDVSDKLKAQLVKPKYEFRRGRTPVIVTHLCFDPQSEWLALMSLNETIHIFRLAENTAAASTTTINKSSDDNTFAGGLFTSAASMVGTFLTSNLSLPRAWASFKLCKTSSANASVNFKSSGASDKPVLCFVTIDKTKLLSLVGVNKNDLLLNDDKTIYFATIDESGQYNLLSFGTREKDNGAECKLIRSIPSIFLA